MRIIIRFLLIDDRMGRFDRQVTVEVQRDTVFLDQVVRQQLTFALDEDHTALLETVAEGFQDLSRLVGYLG